MSYPVYDPADDDFILAAKIMRRIGIEPYVHDIKWVMAVDEIRKHRTKSDPVIKEF